MAMKFRARLTCVLCLSTSLLPSACGPRTSESDAVSVDGRVSCPDCSIDLTPVVTLRPDSSSPRPDAAGRDCLLARTETGLYLFGGTVGGGVLEVFDSTGRQLRTLGRLGAGPGEFGSLIRVVIGASDTIVAIDDSNLRVQVFSPTGGYVRSFSSPARHRSVALLESGTLVFYVPPTKEADQTFAAVDRVGRRAFGTGLPKGRLDVEAGVVAPRGDGGFWTARYWEYLLTRHLATGEPVQQVVVDADWFPANAPFPDQPFHVALPPPGLYHIWEESSGRLWTFTAVPDPAWSAGSPIELSPSWHRKTFDTVIQVLDIDRRRVLVSSRFDDRYAAMCGTKLLYKVTETPDGDTVLEVFDPVVKGLPSTAAGAN